MRGLWKSSIVINISFQDSHDFKILTMLRASISMLLLLLFMCFFIGSTDCIDDPAAYITGDVSINCGSAAVSAAPSGRKWIGDKHPKFSSSLQLKGKSTISSVIRGGSISDDKIPYDTARVSRSAFSYTFLLNPGHKFIRLHFNPTAYKGFKRWKDLFNVVAGPFTLLGNFSASLTGDALGLSSFTKEYCLNVEENQLLSIIFSPATGQSRDAHAFINGIEIIPVTLGHSCYHSGGIGARVIGHESQLFYIDNGTALEMVHRVKFGWDYTSSGDDFGGIFGTREIVPKEKATCMVWKLPVDLGFRYLVRLRFSNRGLKMMENRPLVFKVLINEVVACTNIDIIQERGKGNIILKHDHMDFIVLMKGWKEGGKRHLSLRSCDEFSDGHGPFTGFEIFKLSNFDNSLAFPNPLPSTREASSWIIQSLLSIIAHRNIVTAFVIVIVSLVNIIVHKLSVILESTDIEEENKPSARVERFCRRFSLSELRLGTGNFSDGHLIGKGGFGKVYKCLIDNGSETVAIKRLKSESRQGVHEFSTEIETLSNLRHVNLVSLIGYCNEHKEMIIVYDYMPNGTLADHLYKLERNGTSCSSLAWKQRLDICIGAGRGLDYLHTGNAVIHRDVKVSNILLDENFTAKVSDFGLVKHENKHYPQSHISTNVKGTIGYLDPNYFRTGKLTRKSDVYSFGVVLLEVLCGRPAFDQSVSTDEQILTKWARDKISEGEVHLIVASNLKEEILPDSLKTFVQVVERCLDDEPKKRPTMAQVVLQLEFALEQQETTKSSVSKVITRFAPGGKSTSFDMNTIALETDQFSPVYNIGEGGFGSVYKAIYSTGQIVAVKRLSTFSRTGHLEFENDTLIKNLQHQNIVQLLGYCIHGEERMMVYEFMENGGLDSFIFDEVRRIQFKWDQRFKIIVGIARELLSLHQGSGSRMVRRGPKPSNILLDSEMNLKISDFGLARSLGEDQSYELTTVVAGTRRYLPPESFDGVVSTKSDLYAFGVAVLEIVSGKRGIAFHQDQENLHIASFARRLRADGKIMDLVDESIQDVNMDEALRCIRVGILCTEEDRHQRPKASKVLGMLDGK